MVAPVIAITKSPPFRIKSFAISDLSLGTCVQESNESLPCSISPIRTTFNPESCHHELLKANPDFTLQ